MKLTKQLKNQILAEVAKKEYKIYVDEVERGAMVLLNSTYLTELGVEILINYSLLKNEQFEFHNIDGQFYKEDLSTVEFESITYELIVEDESFDIDLHKYEQDFTDKIITYYTPNTI